ncbi:hypothetical protein AB0K18_43015 [Nonomuraea sp. NPDC049421]|uniref:hypothetical protein n=1 Tax=Nonomuraea sp. NPDC049421 TaxID=3155275 RepID=UPI00342269CA
MSRSDIDKVIAAAKNLKLDIQRCGGSRITVRNPRTRHKHNLSVGTAGSSLDNALTTVRQLSRGTSPAPPPTTEGTDMPRETWWPPRELLMRARRAGVVVWLNGGVLQTSAGPDADYLVRRLHDRADEIIPLLTPNAPTTPPAEEEATTMPTIGETAKITHAAKKRPGAPASRRWDVPEHARLVWDFVREEAREQGNRAFVCDGRQGVLWEGSLRTVCAELNRHQRDDVSRYLAQTLNMRCHSQNAKPLPRWWVADEWNSGDLTVTAAAPAPSPAEEARPARPQDTPPAPSGSALEVLTMWTERTARLTKERDEALERARKAEQRLTEAEKARDEAIAERDELRAYKENIDAAFAQIKSTLQ